MITPIVKTVGTDASSTNWKRIQVYLNYEPLVYAQSTFLTINFLTHQNVDALEEVAVDGVLLVLGQVLGCTLECLEDLVVLEEEDSPAFH